MVITIILLALVAIWLGANPVGHYLARRAVRKRRDSEAIRLTSVTGKVRTVVPPGRRDVLRSSFKRK
jgi:hypothetical protein